MQSKKTLVYLCKYTHYETPFSRHFISGISNCIVWGSINLEALRKILPMDLYETLIKEGQVVLTEPKLYVDITGQEYSGKEYVVIRVFNQ
ncbi:MAG: hypothetical protein QXR24_02960 [Thermosphaera sp.]